MRDTEQFTIATTGHIALAVILALVICGIILAQDICLSASLLKLQSSVQAPIASEQRGI